MSLLYSRVTSHRVASIPRLMIGVRGERRPHHFARRDSKPTSLQSTNSENHCCTHANDFSHSPILTERATSTRNDAMRSVRNLYTPTIQLRTIGACQIELLVRARLVNMTAKALLSFAFSASHKVQGTSSYALGPGSVLLGPKAAY
jgi:hypothetical protein